MSLDGNIGSWVSNAGKDKSIVGLVIIQETLVRLIDSSGNDFTSAGAASSGSARVWKINTGLLSCIKDVDIAWDLKFLLFSVIDQGNSVTIATSTSHHDSGCRSWVLG